MADDVTIDLRPLEGLVRSLQDGPRRLKVIVRGALQRGVRRAANRARELVSGDVLKVRTGSLRRAIESRVEIDGDTLLGRVGILKGSQVLKYAATQEYGATITPKNAKVLTIPLPAAKTAAGVPRFTAREAAGAFEHTFWKRSKAGNLILFGETGGTLTPLFVGVMSVTITPKRFLQRGVAETLPLMINDMQSKVATLLLAEGGGQTLDY